MADCRTCTAEQTHCLTLVVATSNDTAVPFYHAKMLHDGIGVLGLSFVEGADHALIWERPGEFVRVVDDFLCT
jgi:pimeloyl-ACP methyl ester carboxylesterase